MNCTNLTWSYFTPEQGVDIQITFSTVMGVDIQITFSTVMGVDIQITLSTVMGEQEGGGHELYFRLLVVN